MNFGILLFPQVEELDFAGPWEMLMTWSQVVGGPETCLLVAETRSPVVCSKGMSVHPQVSFEDCPRLAIHVLGQRHGRHERAPAVLRGAVKALRQKRGTGVTKVQGAHRRLGSCTAQRGS